MTKSPSLPYLPTMFAACMVFQTLFVLCVALWLAFPDLNGHVLLTEIFPGFKFLDLTSLIYGLIASALYAWFVAAVFVFSYNLWPSFARIVYGK